MHITGCWHCQEPQNTARQIRTLPTVKRMPNVPRGRALEGFMLKRELSTRRQPLSRPPSPRLLDDNRRLDLEDCGPQESLLRAGPCGSSPTVPTVPLARRQRDLDEAFTVSTCSSCLLQSISNCRAKRGRAEKIGQKMGAVPHSCAHFPE